MYNKSADYINEGTTLKIFCSFLNMGRIRRDIWLLMEASFPISQHSNPIHTFLPPIRLSTANSDQIIGDWRDAQTYLSQEPNSGPSNPQESCRNHGQSLCKGTHKFRFQGRKQLKGRKKEGKEPTLDDCFLNPTLASNSSKGAAEHATMASSPGLEGPKVAIWRGTWSRRRWMDIGGGGDGRGREKKEARGSNAATVGMRFPVPLSFSPLPLSRRLSPSTVCRPRVHQRVSGRVQLGQLYRPRGDATRIPWSRGWWVMTLTPFSSSVPGERHYASILGRFWSAMIDWTQYYSYHPSTDADFSWLMEK